MDRDNDNFWECQRMEDDTFPCEFKKGLRRIEIMESNRVLEEDGNARCGLLEGRRASRRSLVCGGYGARGCWGLVRFGVDRSDEKVETRKEGGDVCSETHANEIREMGKVDHGCPAFDKASAKSRQ